MDALMVQHSRELSKGLVVPPGLAKAQEAEARE
jgi:hypothetical protein